MVRIARVRELRFAIRARHRGNTALAKLLLAQAGTPGQVVAGGLAVTRSGVCL
jgi:hypothetical protein